MESHNGRRINLAMWLAVVVLAIAATVVLIVTSARAQELDIAAILRCEAGDAGEEQHCARSRELVIYYCTACHSFVPIVLQQYDAGSWQGLMARHRGWIPNLGQADFEQIEAYLIANFRPDLDPPEMPPELLENWTSY